MKNTTFIALNQITFQAKIFLLRSIIHLFSFPKKKRTLLGHSERRFQQSPTNQLQYHYWFQKIESWCSKVRPIEEQNYKFNMSGMIWSILNGLEMKVPSKKSQRALEFFKRIFNFGQAIIGSGWKATSTTIMEFVFGVQAL